MPIRLTLILLAAIFGAMALAPDAPPRADRSDRAPVVARGDPSAAAPPQADAADRPAPPPAAALAPNRAVPVVDAPRDGAAATAPADPVAPASPSAPADDDDGTGAATLPGFVLSDPGNDAAAALSLSDGARSRAADAARAAAASDATTDLLRGLVGDLAAPEPTSPNPSPAAPFPQPTDPLPPPAGDLARVTGTAVNLRAGPSTADPVVGQVTFGQTVRVLRDTEDGWSEIENPANGELAYIASQFLETLP